MKWIWAALFAVLLSPQSWAKGVSSVEACKVQLNIGPEGTLFEEAQRLGFKLRDQPNHLPSDAPDENKDKPLSAVMLDGKAAVWISEEGRLFVDKTMFGPLKVARPDILSRGDRVQVGQLLHSGSVDSVALIRQLMVANIIMTFAHIGSELCMESTVTGIAVTGTHTYYTNEKNVDELSFRVDIDPSGFITVTGA